MSKGEAKEAIDMEIHLVEPAERWSVQKGKQGYEIVDANGVVIATTPKKEVAEKFAGRHNLRYA